METLNKNWLLILLIAVIFGMLGFLVGRVTGHQHGKKHFRQKSEVNKEIMMDSVSVKVDVDAEGETITTTDTLTRDGKKIIIQEVKKIKK